jgi:Biotin-lipoyl like
MRDWMNVYFPPAMLKQISDLADSKGLSRSAIGEAAVASFLSPDAKFRHLHGYSLVSEITRKFPFWTVQISGCRSAGAIVQLLVQEGDTVGEGQVLAVIEAQARNADARR